MNASTVERIEQDHRDDAASKLEYAIDQLRAGETDLCAIVDAIRILGPGEIQDAIELLKGDCHG